MCIAASKVDNGLLVVFFFKRFPYLKKFSQLVFFLSSLFATNVNLLHNQPCSFLIPYFLLVNNYILRVSFDLKINLYKSGEKKSQNILTYNHRQKC